jgi:small subunit ribosomal protein S7
MKRSLLVNSFVGFLVKEGKRARAELIFFDLLRELKSQFGKDPFEVLTVALEKARPRLDLRPKVVSGTIYRIPALMKPGLDYRLPIKWIVEAAKNRVQGDISMNLFNEVAEAYKGVGVVVRKRDELHKAVFANRPLLKYMSKKKKKKKK